MIVTSLDFDLIIGIRLLFPRDSGAVQRHALTG
jgi:hypothetical protein